MLSQARYVYVSQSSVGGAGGGLIARTDIRQGQAVAFFNGVRRHQVHADFSTDHDSDYVIKLRSAGSAQRLRCFFMNFVAAPV